MWVVCRYRISAHNRLQVTQDQQYFQRVKWQYMILDEAQNIKNSSSVRWKTLLGFHCRNRLLLTGTPIQNSMQGKICSVLIIGSFLILDF